MIDIIEEDTSNIENGLSDSVEETTEKTEELFGNPAETSENEVLYVVSDNGVTKEEFYILIDEVKGLREDVKNKQYTVILGGVSANSVSNDQAISLSDNIIDKPLRDYNTSESMALIGLVLAFSAFIIYLIHKTVFRIRR